MDMDQISKNRFTTFFEFEIDSLIRVSAGNIATLHNRQSDLKFDLKPQVVLISDESLNTVLKELLENSLKYSEPGTPIEIKGSTEEDKYLISITDHGIGMSADQLSSPRSFQQYNRGISAQHGNGLGLIIVEKILFLLGSKLNIVSEPSAGTTFEFWINIKSIS
jgi:signal transduction histidine kinase